MRKILVIQTAFIGDVVLATGILEKLHARFPDAALDILVRQGNETLFTGHPFLHSVLVWNKKKSKYRNLFRVLLQIRAAKYDVVINVQRFAATGLLTAFSGAKRKIGFDKNPFRLLFTDVIRHVVSKEGHSLHETERNHLLIASLTDTEPARPRLYPASDDRNAASVFMKEPFICIAPASVWFTKQFPVHQWQKLMNAVPGNINICLLGAGSDNGLCAEIMSGTSHPSVQNLAGKLNFLASAALMEKAMMNYVNDSAPMHFASSVNAPVTAVYCSTLPAFGFGPLSDNRHVIEVAEQLPCRPCGLHGKKACPEGHFNCAGHITTAQLLAVLPQGTK